MSEAKRLEVKDGEKVMENNKQQNDWIYVVKEKSDIERHYNRDFFGWEKYVKNKRVIPHSAHISISGYSACKGKIRNEDAVAILFTVDTGITLRYKDEQWREESQFEIIIPFDKAMDIADDIIRTVKRHHGLSPTNRENKA